ncbi:MAG: hypothetical protein IKS28_06835 [Clostridia bacterium]|nr:hypothetical protein [Clostridia bacterium]
MDAEMIPDVINDDTAVKRCPPEKLEEMKTALRKYRCELLDDLHERQRRLDRVDLAIRRTEKELKERKMK